ncbi:unnamed protein product [Rhizophagus irregularis]|nr:unnamed protein product [Rhizophagus irregularis]
MFARYRIREFFWAECPACFQNTHRTSLTLQMIPLLRLPVLGELQVQKFSASRREVCYTIGVNCWDDS